MYVRFLKRAFDVFFASLMLLGLSPLLLVTALAILLEDGGPVLFRQNRVGAGGELFTMFKFRSMPTTTPHLTSVLANGKVKITRVGRIIRISNMGSLHQTSKNVR